MTTTSTFDIQMAQVAAGEPLPADDIKALAASPDVLATGMLADALRRRLHGDRATFSRVAFIRSEDAGAITTIEPAAREVRLIGAADTLAAAVASVGSLRAAAGDRLVSAFSWRDVMRLAGGTGAGAVLAELRRAGLDALAELPLDALDDAALALQHVVDAGLLPLRLTIDKAEAAARVDLLLAAARLRDRFSGIVAINPLPMTLNTFRPTTGYDDVKMVAIARLAAANVPSVQVDWQRYGPKLAQVALTFGADDIDGVSPSDAAPEGRRRAPLEEIRRNIQAAGLTPAERDGRFAIVG
jgi:aminodeoxyfutalosine synthase